MTNGNCRIKSRGKNAVENLFQRSLNISFALFIFIFSTSFKLKCKMSEGTKFSIRQHGVHIIWRNQVVFVVCQYNSINIICIKFVIYYYFWNSWNNIISIALVEPNTRHSVSKNNLTIFRNIILYLLSLSSYCTVLFLYIIIIIYMYSIRYIHRSLYYIVYANTPYIIIF